MSRKRVELEPAFAWLCPKCGTRNFETPVPAELNAEERQELQEDHGVSPSAISRFFLSPKTVLCMVCQHEFRTKVPVDN